MNVDLFYWFMTGNLYSFDWNGWLDTRCSTRYLGRGGSDQAPERGLHRQKGLRACWSNLRTVCVASEVVWGAECSGGPMWENGPVSRRSGRQVRLDFPFTHDQSLPGFAARDQTRFVGCILYMSVWKRRIIQKTSIACKLLVYLFFKFIS